MGRIDRKVALGVLILAICVVLEVYAHFYVEMHVLSVVTEEEAMKLSPAQHTGTYTFSGSGCRWLVVWRIDEVSPSVNYGWVYMFKIEQNKSPWVIDKGWSPFKLETESNNTVMFWAELDAVLYEANRTTLRIEYDFGKIGTYEINLTLVSKIYERTIVGLLPKEDVRIPISVTLYYGP